MHVHAHTDHPRPDQVVARPLGVRLLAALGGGFITVVIVGIAAAAVGDFVVIVGLPVIGYAIVRGFRISLVADGDDITIRNYFRTYRLRWAEVAEMGIGVHQMGGVLSDAIFFRRHGRRLVVTAQATMLTRVERERVLRDLARLHPDLRVGE
jgi:hypothetical protein